MNKYLKRFLFFILIIGSTAFLTSNVSIIGLKFIKGYHHGYREASIENTLLNSCGCKEIEKIKTQPPINEVLSFKNKDKVKYVLRKCNSINIESFSKKVSQELLKERFCFRFNIEVILYNRQNDSTSFHINNCNIELNEKI